MLGFGRRRSPAAATLSTEPAAASARRGRFIAVTTVEALPDTATINHVHALQSAIGAGLQGQGTAIGYDRGDPAVSLMAPVQAHPGVVAEAIAAVYAYHQPPAPDEISGALETNPKLDPYNSLLWARLAR